MAMKTQTKYANNTIRMNENFHSYLRANPNKSLLVGVNTAVQFKESERH